MDVRNSGSVEKFQDVCGADSAHNYAEYENDFELDEESAIQSTSSKQMQEKKLETCKPVEKACRATKSCKGKMKNNRSENLQVPMPPKVGKKSTQTVPRKGMKKRQKQ
jgi:hypothetical protein